MTEDELYFAAKKVGLEATRDNQPHNARWRFTHAEAPRQIIYASHTEVECTAMSPTAYARYQRSRLWRMHVRAIEQAGEKQEKAEPRLDYSFKDWTALTDRIARETNQDGGALELLTTYLDKAFGVLQSDVLRSDT